MIIKFGIVGAGHIAAKMADTLVKMNHPEIVLYAISSRSLEKAQAFAQKWGIPKAYGSYEDMMADPQVNLVYIATPHSHHYAPARMAVEAGKAVLCEKAFMANAREAEALLALSRERGVFVTEAIKPRYMPLSLQLREILDSGQLGRPRQLQASLCYPIDTKERILRPELCGGVLLDLGVYCLNFLRLCFGGDIVQTESSCILVETGVDLYDSMMFRYRDGKVATLVSSALTRCNREGVVSCDEGFIVVENVNSPSALRIYRDYRLTAEYHAPKDQLTGYEYQVLACKDAMEKGWVETPFMPHAEILAVMRQMDALRAHWGVRYPMDA